MPICYLYDEVHRLVKKEKTSINSRRKFHSMFNAMFNAKIGYTASQGFCFASAMPLNDLNDLRIIGSVEFYTGLFAAGREHAARKPKCNHKA